MHHHRAVYRGYSGVDSAWSYRIEPLTPEFPILRQPKIGGFSSWARALRVAKREVDRIIAG